MRLRFTFMVGVSSTAVAREPPVDFFQLGLESLVYALVVRHRRGIVRHSGPLGQCLRLVAIDREARDQVGPVVAVDDGL